MLTQASTDLEKCVKLFKTEITVQDAEDAKPLCFKESDVLQGRAGDIRFEKVSFMYTGSERGSAGGLRNISFHVKPGNMVALVGASGAGKR